MMNNYLKSETVYVKYLCQIMRALLQQWPLFLASGIALIAVEQAGLLQGWTSPVLARLQSPNSTLPVSSGEGAWISSALSLSSVVCTPLPAVTMHYLGRKLSILISVFPFIIHWIVVSVASSTAELIVARVIGGMGTAFIYTVFPVYLGEISPDDIRGGIGLGISVVSNVGILWIYWIGTYPDLWVSSLTCALPLLIVLGLYKWLPESPYYLIAAGRKQEAEEALRKLKNCSKVDEDVAKIEEAISTNSNSNSFKELFVEESHRRALLICLGTFTISQLSGGVTFLFYAHLIFQKAGNVSANMMSLIKATAQLITSIAAAYVVDSVGRKPLLLISCVGSAVFMFCEGLYFYLLDIGYNVDSIWWLPLVSMILFNIFQVIGLTSISISYLGELFHPKVKSVAVCVSKAYLSVLVSVVAKLYQVMTDGLGNSVPFFVFSAVGLIGVLFVLFCVPETKGRSLEEIQYYMKHKCYRNDKM